MGYRNFQQNHLGNWLHNRLSMIKLYFTLQLLNWILNWYGFGYIWCRHALSFVLQWSYFAEYTDEKAHIPKHSSVIVRRIPIGGVKPAGRTFIVYVCFPTSSF